MQRLCRLVQRLCVVVSITFALNLSDFSHTVLLFFVLCTVELNQVPFKSYVRLLALRVLEQKHQANVWLLPLFVQTKIHYREDLGGGTALPETPEMERVKQNQRNISAVLHRVTPDPLLNHSPPAIFPPSLSSV